MEIIRADYSGFCFGVKKAISITEEQIEKKKREGGKGNIYTLGPLIHNASVIEELEEKGVKTIDDYTIPQPGDTLIIRSHGEPKSFYDAMEGRGVELIDTTCPFVSKIHELVGKAFQNNKEIIIVGDKDHQEVIATNGWADNKAIILGTIEEAEAFGNQEMAQGQEKNYYLVCQTTIRKELLEEILLKLKEKGILPEVENTICNATTQRQDACRELAKKMDAMVIIGGKNSSNTRKLFEIANKYCNNTFFAENNSDLPLKEMSKYYKIGVAESVIKEVIASMSDTINETKLNEETMESFMDEIDASLKLPRSGEIVDGKVFQVTDKEVIVDLGCKKDGILPVEEVTLEEGESLTSVFHPGDEIRAKVIKTDGDEGSIRLSKKKLEVGQHWDEICEAHDDKSIINVKVVRAVNGGVIAAYKEVTGFIPMSQLSNRYVEDADEFIGENFDVRVIRVDPKRNRAVFSHKVVLNDEKQKHIEGIWENLNVDDVVEGTVMRFTNYGAFVDIGGIDGLLHISEISWGKLRHPQEVLNIGDKIAVKILSMNQEKGKISLGLKQITPEPWTIINDKYQVGETIKGKVVQIKEYGAFVELEPGLDGLVHISEVAHKRVNDINDELKPGQEVEAKILDIDVERKRISLSIKACVEPTEEELKAAAAEKEEAEVVEASEEVVKEASEVSEATEEVKKDHDDDVDDDKVEEAIEEIAEASEEAVEEAPTAEAAEEIAAQVIEEAPTEE